MTAESKLNPGFGDRLIKLLTQADIRPKDLAARIDVPLEVVEACLKGKVPEAEVLYRMAKGLDVTMEWLLTGEEVRLPKETLH
jgi:transcriptional regulator with XRE-family HTH domain